MEDNLKVTQNLQHNVLPSYHCCKSTMTICNDKEICVDYKLNCFHVYNNGRCSLIKTSYDFTFSLSSAYSIFELFATFESLFSTDIYIYIYIYGSEYLVVEKVVLYYMCLILILLVLW